MTAEQRGVCFYSGQKSILFSIISVWQKFYSALWNRSLCGFALGKCFARFLKILGNYLGPRRRATRSKSRNYYPQHGVVRAIIIITPEATLAWRLGALENTRKPLYNLFEFLRRVKYEFSAKYYGISINYTGGCAIWTFFTHLMAISFRAVTHQWLPSLLE